MRTGSTLNYLLSDHLGSTSLVTDASGNVLSQQKYKAWGETRYASGSMPTKYQYTGQYSHATEFGLLFYNSRFYDPSLGRFASADTIVPGGVQGLDRYAYVNNNPLRYTDPTGHMCSDPDDLWSPSCDGADTVGQVSHGGGLGVGSGSSSGSTGREEEEDTSGLIQPTVQSHAGYSNADLDELYFFWEYFFKPINDLIELDDIYRISGKGGWKTARLSLNLGVVEAIVQGGHQAYRDSWYETLTPGQRIARAVIVGGEALVTDAVADRVGKGFRNAGYVTGGPLGAAAGNLAGNTFATNTIDRIWREKVNPLLFQRLGDLPQ